MPAGYVNCWVSKKHDTYPEVPIGWGFVPTAVSVVMIATDCAVQSRSVPQRYLPMPDRTTFEPVPMPNRTTFEPV